jgi:hypothetical protein
MSDDAVDYSGTSDSDSESDKVPEVQLERNRAFWRMISASFIQDSDAHLHRRNRRRSASVTRSSATPPHGASSSSNSDTADAGAADDGDYEPEERSAGNTPEATVGDMFQGDLASSTTQAQALAHSATHLISAELCSAHAYNRGLSPSPIPDLPGIGGPSPSPSPICGGSGIIQVLIPIPGSHRGFRALQPLLREGSTSSDHTVRASTRDDNRGNSMCH